MSLSQEPVYSLIKNRFVCGYKNIMGEKYAGNSGTHTTRGQAVDTTNGAGSHNIQIFVMNPDGTVLHCLPGYWNPRDLASELDFAQKLNSLYEQRDISQRDKAMQFAHLQLDHARQHPSDEVARSHLQGFDMKHEMHKAHSDFINAADKAALEGPWNKSMCAYFKTTDFVMHERMAKRPFLQYSAFDVAHFADYGTHTYDKHEDSLNEYGQKVADTPFQPLKNAKTLAALRKGTTCGVGGASTPKTYIKTYGTVRTQSSQN